MDLLEFLSYGFFQRALVGGTIAAIACAAVGVIILLRKEAMIGHGIAQPRKHRRFVQRARSPGQRVEQDGNWNCVSAGTCGKQAA